MPDNTRGYTEIERRALSLLAAGWEIRNAQGPVQANSHLMDPSGSSRIALGRGTMAKLRNAGLIAYVQGHAALARITQRGRTVVEGFTTKEAHA